MKQREGKKERKEGGWEMEKVVVVEFERKKTVRIMVDQRILFRATQSIRQRWRKTCTIST